MTATGEKTLNQKVCELLGHTWQDGNYNGGMYNNLDYENNLQAAWQCVEYMKGRLFSRRMIFKNALRKICLLTDADNLDYRFMHWEELIFRIDAKAICLAFVEAMQGE